MAAAIVTDLSVLNGCGRSLSVRLGDSDTGIAHHNPLRLKRMKDQFVFYISYLKYQVANINFADFYTFLLGKKVQK